MSDWKPFESFLEYLRVVRQASDATRAEMITVFVMTAKWIYFQNGNWQSPGQIPCIRQAMDVRNRLHNSARRTRSDKTEDELKAEGKWLQWFPVGSEKINFAQNLLCPQEGFPV